eukprot:6780478-Prymnesium_polylepis.1
MPDVFGTLRHIEYWDTYGNSLSGDLPNSIMNASTLECAPRCRAHTTPPCACAPPPHARLAHGPRGRCSVLDANRMPSRVRCLLRILRRCVACCAQGALHPDRADGAAAQLSVR